MIHTDKKIVIADQDFKDKILEAALQYAKRLLLGTITNPSLNVKRFGQIVLKEITVENPSWLDGLSYFTLSNNPTLTKEQALAADQATVTAELNIIFPYFAKAWYGDIS